MGSRVRLDPPDQEVGLVVVEGIGPVAAPFVEQLERRVVRLDRSPFCIGRSPEADLTLEVTEVSRRHCCLEHVADGWRVRDMGSSNGTWVGERQLESGAASPVVPGDHIRVGGIVLEFLSGSDLQSRGATLCLPSFDEVTGLPNRVAFQRRLEAGGWGQVTALLVDQLEPVEGLADPARILAVKWLATLLESLLPASVLLARWSDTAFVAVSEACWNGWDTVLKTVASNPCPIVSETVRLTISAGTTTGEIAGAVERCLALARVAHEEGGNRCLDARATRQPRRHAEPLARLVSSLPSCGALVAIAIDKETVLRLLGPEGHQRWLSQLLNDALGGRVDRSVAAWRGSTLFVALDPKRPVAKMIEEVKEAWTRRPVPLEHRHQLVRTLHCVWEPRCSEASLDRLASVLAQAADTSLPYPLEALRPVIATHRSAFMRAKTLCDALESDLQFLAAVELGFLLGRADTGVIARLVEVLAHYRLGQPMGMGAWRNLALELAHPVAGIRDEHPAVAVARALLAHGAGGSSIARSLEKAVQLRNRYLVHATPQHDDFYQADERFLAATLDQLTDALRPLGRCRLVSVAGVVDLEAEGATRYELAQHQGQAERFPVWQESLGARLGKHGWCYLLGPDKQALLLAPIVMAVACQHCGRLEIFMAERLIIGPSGARVRGKAITTVHEAEAAVPPVRSLEALHEALEARGRAS